MQIFNEVELWKQILIGTTSLAGPLITVTGFLLLVIWRDDKSYHPVWDSCTAGFVMFIGSGALCSLGLIVAWFLNVKPANW